jgi:hypothetical protein
MLRGEADQWDRADERRRERERANRSRSVSELITFTVSMSPDEYATIQKNASWEGKTVANYLVDNALGKTRRGC